MYLQFHLQINWGTNGKQKYYNNFDCNNCCSCSSYRCDVFSTKTINAGDSLVVKLTDCYGNPISNETINIKLTDKDGKSINKDIKTNSKGKVKYKIDEKGTYSVECKFNGNDQYASNSVLENVSVKKATTNLVSEDKTSNYDSVSGLSEDGYSYYPSSGPAVDSMGQTREQAIAKNMHYIPQTIDGRDSGVYVPYDSKAGCYHT